VKGGLNITALSLDDADFGLSRNSYTAFVVNKGGYYFTHLAPAATRAVPGIFFVGGKDEAFRVQSIQGIFAVNRQAGCAWKLNVETETGHEQGQSRERAVEFFTEVISRRR
jgi:hypothetical protein